MSPPLFYGNFGTKRTKEVYYIDAEVTCRTNRKDFFFAIVGKACKLYSETAELVGSAMRKLKYKSIEVSMNVLWEFLWIHGGKSSCSVVPEEFDECWKRFKTRGKEETVG